MLSVALAALLAGASLQPAGWDKDLKLAEAVDRNPDPHIVEIDLDARISHVEIAPGISTDAWTYNGGIPGPLIRLHVGDRLIVHFTNHLPQPTTVHWHGLRLPIEMDGVPDVSQPPVPGRAPPLPIEMDGVPDVSQPPVPEGGSFTYDFVVRDAGLYWYHPHVMSAAQVGFGLYGALLVEDDDQQV